jgi:tRNA1(Val) A37 N6-methylase TrmN6
MKEFFSFKNVNEIGVYISLFLSFCTLCYWTFKYVTSLINYSRIKNVKAGIYNGAWLDPIKKEINCEVLRLKKTLRGIKIVPIYKHKAYHDYKVIMKPYSLNQYIFGGRWFGQKNTTYKGYSLFLYNIKEETFNGKWIGPKSTGEANNGDWRMIFLTEGNNSYLNYRRFRQILNLKEKIFSSSTLLANIIQKHESFKADTCTVKNIELSLNKDSFIPTLGKISIHFAEYIQSLIRETDTVLDLGTGAGFYPIYLAKNNGCKVKGIDLDDRTITLARSNAIKNKVSHLLEFTTCKKSELFFPIKRSERFDYIIANLPFTRVSKSYKSRNSVYYSSFSGSVALLEQLILGSQYHIKPNGKLIFC